VKAVNGARMKEYKNKWQTTALKSQLGYAVWVVTHFQLPTYEYPLNQQAS